MEGQNTDELHEIKVLYSVETSSTPASVQESINIWKERPNLVNRRLCGCVNFWNKSYSWPRITQDWNELYASVSKEVVEEISAQYGSVSDSKLDDLGLNIKRFLVSCLEYYKTDEESEEEKQPQQQQPDIDFQLRKLLPRSLNKFQITIELIASRKVEGMVQGTLCSGITE